MIRRTGLARSGPLKPQSSGLCATKRAQRRAYREAGQAEWCQACGKPGPTDHSHILSQGNHKAFRNNPLNWLDLCRSCHDCWEHHKARFAERFPEAFAEKMRRMELLDSQAHEFFKMKHPTLF